MPCNRREFLTRGARTRGSGGLCRYAAEFTDLRGNLAWPQELFGKALFAKIKWFNEPASATQSGDQLVVRTKPKTDYRRKTFHDYVTDHGHFFFLPVIGNFALESCVAGKYGALYDQAGLMVRIEQKFHLHALRLSSYAGFGRRWHHVMFARRSWLRIAFRPDPFDAWTCHRISGKEHGHVQIPWAV